MIPACGPERRRRGDAAGPRPGARRPWTPATCRSAPSCSRPTAGRSAGGLQPRARRRPTRPAHAEILALRAAGDALGDVAARRLHPRGHAGTVHDVRRRAGAGAGGDGWCSGPGTRRRARPARCGTWSATAGSTTGSRSSAGSWRTECGEPAADLLRRAPAAARPRRPALVRPTRAPAVRPPRPRPLTLLDSVRRYRPGTLCGGGVSERPKEHASKACEGATPPWVQIPPPPL